ncbi:MAG: Nif3-like dinuclear metal center hexameric protein [Synergistaceae bacterium]|jgi:dinuclear metal center YbgI/SA1388 family protein|nr:Nif3-like dinuclear metal center hexameric protein [Synergistaceae bacterium]
MNVGEAAAKIEERLPLAWSEEWDNSGLLIGDPAAMIERIAVSLDATEGTVRDAREHGCGMLVVHHPAIFMPMKKIVSPSPVAKMVRAAITEGVAVYSAHTNWDSSPEGVNVILSRQLGLLDVSPIMPPHDGAWGMGAIGNLAGPMTVSGLAGRIKELWGLSTLLTYGDDTAPLSRVALCGGAGGDLLQAAISMSADVFITADVSYHYLLHAQLTSTHLIVVNHGEMERASLPNFCALVREASSLDVVLLENSNWTPLVI